MNNYRAPGTGFKPKFPHEVELAREKREDMYASNMNDSFGLFQFGHIHICQTTIVDVLTVMISDGMGWDHISVSTKDHCPTWDQMNWVKDLFFVPECCVIQFHPPKSKYVNNHPFVLHMWHKQGVDYELPPREMV